MAMVGVSLAVAAGRLDGGHVLGRGPGARAVAARFVAFMTLVDVPKYVRKWRRDRLQGQTYLSLRDGLRDARSRRITTTEWVAWRPEVAWLTGYFSLAVWISLSLVRLSLP
jgi:hypothetical protein